MSDEAGYKKPPKKDQFVKGQCPNRNGRPRTRVRDREAVALSKLVRDVLYREVSATENGKKIKVTSLELVLRQMLRDAINGDPKAREQILKLAESADSATRGECREQLHITIHGGLPDG